MTSAFPLRARRLGLPVAFLYVAAIRHPLRSAADVAVSRSTISCSRPTTLEVAVGTTVVWTNDDDIPHTVVAPDLSYKSKAIDTETPSPTLSTKPGTYDYFCSLHPHMTG